MDDKDKIFQYQIDSEDNLVRVTEEWLRFAVDNGWQGFTEKSVLNRPIWDFIQDMETRHIYRLIFSKVREASTIVLIPFRCDSPDLRRFMEMELVPEPQNSIEINCRLLKVEHRPYMRLLDPSADRSGEFLTICSWCKRIKTGSVWLEVEDAVKRLKLFESEKLPQLTHGACPACFGSIRKALGRSEKGAA